MLILSHLDSHYVDLTVVVKKPRSRYSLIIVTNLYLDNPVAYLSLTSRIGTTIRHLSSSGHKEVKAQQYESLYSLPQNHLYTHPPCLNEF